MRFINERKEIVAGKTAFNFHEELEPQFYSDRVNFSVTLFNLNYGVELKQTGSHDEKQAFDKPKTGFQGTKQAFNEVLEGLGFARKTVSNIQTIYQQYGEEQGFSRADVMQLLHITATPATTLLAKMKEAALIELADGKSRGKYRFKAQ